MLLLLWLITCQNYRDFEDVFAHRLCVKLRDTSVKERKKEKESRRSCTEMFKKKKKNLSSYRTAIYFVGHRYNMSYRFIDSFLLKEEKKGKKKRKKKLRTSI